MIADKTVDAEDENANATFTAGRWWTVQTRARHQTKRLCKLRALYSNTVSGRPVIISSAPSAQATRSGETEITEPGSAPCASGQIREDQIVNFASRYS